MINKTFIEETDKIIARLKDRGVVLENGNVLVAKVKTDRVTKGGIILADDAVDLEDYHNGFARILALPRLLDSQNGDADLKVGDYVLHSHEARYKPYTPALREMLDLVIEDNFVYAVQDADVIITVSQSKFQ